MKNTVNSTNLALIGVMVVLLISAWKSPAAAPLVAPPVAARAEAQTLQDSECSSERSVQVSGAAVINVTPDRTLIQLGVQSNGTTPDGVRAENANQIQQVTNAIRNLGVEAKDIASDFYIVYPVYEDYNALAIKGYRIDNTISVTVRDVNLADDVILAALKVGANEVQDVQFYTSELRKYRDQAREQATKAATEKAQALAQAAGGQVGCVLSINENSWSQYYGARRGGREATMWAQNVIQNAPNQGQATASEDSPLSLGQIAVRAAVSASFSLR